MFNLEVTIYALKLKFGSLTQNKSLNLVSFKLKFIGKTRNSNEQWLHLLHENWKFRILADSTYFVVAFSELQQFFKEIAVDVLLLVVFVVLLLSCDENLQVVSVQIRKVSFVNFEVSLDGVISEVGRGLLGFLNLKIL